MIGEQIDINSKDKTVDIFVDDITIDELKDVLKHFSMIDDYEFRIHNPKQSTCLMEVYSGNISVDKLLPDRNFFGSEDYYNGGVIREHNPDPHISLNNFKIDNLKVK